MGGVIPDLIDARPRPAWLERADAQESGQRPDRSHSAILRVSIDPKSLPCRLHSSAIVARAA